jgi:hypothetical protein
MRYLLLAYGDEKKNDALSESELRSIGARCQAYDEELRRTGRLVAGGSLGWAATTLRLAKGKLVVTDGPFLESKELVGGFIVIEARDLDEAIRTAKLHPAARMGEELGWGIELRPMEQCMALEALASTGS